MPRSAFRLMLVAVVAAVLFGCATPHAPLAQSTNCSSGGPPCRVAVVNAANCDAATVDRDPIRFPRSTPERPNNNIRVFWEIDDPNFGFCPSMGDGVRLKSPDPDDQFDVVGAENPSGPGVCNQRRFVLIAKNTKPRPTDPYRYAIVFHDKSGQRKCTIDPEMIND